ncbi:MAG: LptF/LptG family permease [Bacteroidota bacterium]|nr:LptF/LptG family permease [Bacteroidota bacterium]
MKILDRYIIQNYLITFTFVFVILFFIFILYGLWLYIPDLAGKGIDLWIIIKFMSYFMPTMIPLILPLTILLSSIMTFGAFAENYEFAAMKSAGLSLSQISKGLTIFIFFISCLAFFFANDIIPYSKYKAKNFRHNLKDKPTIGIVEGQFSDIGLYNIKVGKKHGKEGELLDDVIIHKRNNVGKNILVTRAKRGEFISEKNSNYLKLVLHDGVHYEDITPKDYLQQRKYPFAKATFDKYIMNIDISTLINVDLDSDSGSDTNELLNTSELLVAIDSLRTDLQDNKKSLTENIHHRTTSVFQNHQLPTENTQQAKSLEHIKQDFSQTKQHQIYESAQNIIAAFKFNLFEHKTNLEYKTRTIKVYRFALHEKFAIAYSCLLMFFIGAPLGAIIRKGGLGLPSIFAIIVFIIYHFSSTFGRKMAQDGDLSVFWGAWGAAIIITPLAILLTYKATNDKSISFDWLIEPITRLFRKIFHKNKKHK